METNIHIVLLRYDLTRRLSPLSMGHYGAMACVHMDTLWKLEVKYETLFCQKKCCKDFVW